MAAATLTIDFGSDGTVAGNAGVNTHSGPFKATDNTVGIGPLATTRMAGPEDLMNQEAAFLEALQNSTTWTIARGLLEMRNADGAMQVTATAKP